MLDVTKIGSYREDNRLEAKLATGGLPESLWETYSAFANTYGGVILLGVEELPDRSLRIQGLLDAQEMAQQLRAMLDDPRIASENLLAPEQLSVVDTQSGQIIIMEVPRAEPHQRPVYVGGSVYAGSYHRCGDGDYRLTREDIDAMLAAGRSKNP